MMSEDNPVFSHHAIPWGGRSELKTLLRATTGGRGRLEYQIRDQERVVDMRINIDANGLLSRLAPVLACAGVLLLTACSSSLGGGSSAPSQPGVVVLPNGARVVCSDGTAPPCH